jgi:hypothetical protein
MAQEIDINLNVNAQQADKSLGSLKSQLREAQADVQTLADKFGATSREAVEAAKRAAELKDRIGDAKTLTDAFNPDAKFKALSSSLTGVASGFAAYQGALGLAGVESKKLQEQLLQVQSAMALAQGLQGLGEARDSFQQLGAVAKSVFAGIKNAIGATGIGLLVIAAGALYAYWDDIKEAVNGVSNEQKKLNQLAEQNVQTANENLKAAKSMDNTLKLQGKSEQQILDIKIKATQATIDANISRVKGLQLTNKLEAEAAERNYERLKSFIDFVSIPQRILFETAATAINKIIDLANKIPGIEIKGKIDENFASKATDYITKLAFDPAKTKAEGAATLKATQDAIKDLTNERDGYRVSKNKQDAEDAEKGKQHKKDEVLSEHEKLENLKKLTDEYNKKLREEDIQIPDEIDVTGLENKAANDVKFKEEELERQRAQELALAQIYYDSVSEREKREEEERQRKIQSFQATTEAVGSIAKSGEELLSSIQATGLAKGKAGQAAMKALALVQIGVDSAVAFSKMMQGTEQSAAGAATGAPGPAAPAVYLATKIAFYATGTATILANIARAKALLSGGGGGGGGAAGGGGGAVPPAPSFNVVGPSGANQIAESIAGKESQPLKAFVVGGDVTSQQSLNRGIVQNATLG